MNAFGFIGLEHLLFLAVILTRQMIKQKPEWVDTFMKRRSYRKKNKSLESMFSSRMGASKMGAKVSGLFKK